MGKKNRRRKDARFDWRYYLEMYPDLVEAGIRTRKQARSHYMRWGVGELRLASGLDWRTFKHPQYRSGREMLGLQNIRVLISSLDYPSYGGAATNAYQIVKFLRSNAINCAGLFFNYDVGVSYDPEKLGGIFISPLLHTISKREQIILRKRIIKYLGGEPNYCLGKNYMAPLYCRLLFPFSYVVYLVSGINHFHQYYGKRGLCAQQVLDPKFIITEKNNLEKECISRVDLIIFNSRLTARLFRKIYPDSRPKLYPFVINTSGLAASNGIPNKGLDPQKNKNYDIIICCSNLNRIDKNNQFSLNLLKSNFHSYKKLIIGKNYKQYSTIPNAKCVGLVSRQQCLNYLSQSRILLYPSLFDSNPSTVVEALTCNCIPIISNNVGNYQEYPKYMVCQTFQDSEWIEKIGNLLNYFT